MLSSSSTWFTTARFGMFIHWGLYSINARNEWLRGSDKLTEAQYRVYFDEFNPGLYNPRDWARLAKAAGMKYAVLTTKHHDGFCLFDSALTDFKAPNSPASRDLVRPYVDAFRAEGLKVGFYYSLLDWHHPHYTIDRHHPFRDLPSDHPVRTTRHFPTYLDYMHGQVRELMTNYGPIDLLWFDFSFDDKTGEAWRTTDLVRMVRSLQPNILLNNRLTGSLEANNSPGELGDINTPEQWVPDQGVTDAKGSHVLWESCITLNDHWGYARDDHNFKTAAQVVRMLVECVSKGGNLLLNVGPTPRPEIPEASASILRRVGQWMHHNSGSITGCSRSQLPKPDWGRYTQKGNALYAHIFERPMGPLRLEGLADKIRRIHFLADGSELPLGPRPWNVPQNSPDLFINLPPTPLPDDLDTVLQFTLAS